MATDLMEKWAEERRARREHRMQMAFAVAQALGASWGAEPDRDDEEARGVLLADASAPHPLRLLFGQERDRIVVVTVKSSEYENHKPYSLKWPRITVADDAEPERIAADIRRRFLPLYDEILGAVRTRIAEVNRRARDADEVDRALRAAWPFEITERGAGWGADKVERKWSSFLTVGGRSFRLTVQHRGEGIGIEVEGLDQVTALAVIRAISGGLEELLGGSAR